MILVICEGRLRRFHGNEEALPGNNPKEAKEFDIGL